MSHGPRATGTTRVRPWSVRSMRQPINSSVLPFFLRLLISFTCPYSTMDILTIYATIGAGLAVCLSLRRYIYFLFSFLLNKRIVRACFQWGIRPYLVRRRSLFGPITYSRITWWLVHWGSTVTCNFLGIQNWHEASSRAGTLALLHIVPLFFSQQFSMAADIFGISLKAYQLLHQAFGAMAIVQSALHVAISLRDVAFDFGDRALRYGFVVTISPFFGLLKYAYFTFFRLQ